MKILSLLLWTFLLVVTPSQPVPGQTGNGGPVASPDTAKDSFQDGLKGPVRRVRVETAKIVVKNGKLTEEGRIAREVTTYDVKGTRLDKVVYPVESSRPNGTKQFRHDDKGNIIEMVLLGDGGLVLSKETYQYEFDALGNWRKMTASIGIYEDGKLSFEPIEITYRTIAYFYNDAVQKISASANQTDLPDRKTEPAVNESSQTSSLQPTGAPVAMPNSANPNALKPDNRTAEKESASLATVAAPKKIAVKHVSETVLRAAALELPQPSFPQLGHAAQNQRIEVQLVINERGEVTSAKGSSSTSVLNEAAEAAARKARFVPSKLSEEPTQIFSVLTYEFAPPPSTPAAPVVSDSKDVRKSLKSPSSTQPDATTSLATGVSPSNSESLYKQGVAYLATGQVTKAVESLQKFVYANPEDAQGYSKLGMAYLTLRQYKDAVAAIKMAIKVRPDRVGALTYYHLGVAYDALNKHSDSQKAFQEALVLRRAQIAGVSSDEEAGPPLALIHYNIGLEFNEMRNFHDAVKELKESSKLDPKLAETYYLLGLVYLNQFDRRSADKQLAVLKELKPELAKKLNSEIENRSRYFPPGCTELPCR